MNFEISNMRPEDWPAVREIYGEGIATGNATFETELPDWRKWDAGHRADCRLIARETEIVIGWAALSVVSTRKVYSGVAEVSVYVTSSARGRGAGKALLKRLLEESERGGIWTLQAGIFPENLCQRRASQIVRISRGWRAPQRGETRPSLEGCVSP